MAIILDRKYTIEDSNEEIINAIYKIASDKNKRVLLVDCIEWQNKKLKEIKRLTKILKDRTNAEISTKSSYN